MESNNNKRKENGEKLTRFKLVLSEDEYNKLVKARNRNEANKLDRIIREAGTVNKS